MKKSNIKKFSIINKKSLVSKKDSSSIKILGQEQKNAEVEQIKLLTQKREFWVGALTIILALVTIALLAGGKKFQKSQVLGESTYVKPVKSSTNNNSHLTHVTQLANTSGQRHKKIQSPTLTPTPSAKSESSSSLGSTQSQSSSSSNESSSQNQSSTTSSDLSDSPKADPTPTPEKKEDSTPPVILPIDPLENGDKHDEHHEEIEEKKEQQEEKHEENHDSHEDVTDVIAAVTGE